MKRLLLIAALLFPASAQAETWTKLSGPEIQAALEGHTLQYKNAWQDFRASGRTLYNAGRDSWGYWNVRDDQYCSMWPPSDLWACYDMERYADRLRFVGDNNDITEAIYKD